MLYIHARTNTDGHTHADTRTCTNARAFTHFTGPPPQVQLVLIFQLVIQFRLAPFIEAKLDVVETLLTIVLCVLSFCGMAFSLGGPSLPLLAAGSEGPHGESPGTAYVMAMVFAWLNLGLGLGLTWFGILSEARIVFL
jgi:hypothetical protein